MVRRRKEVVEVDVNVDLDNFINVIFIYVVNNQVFVMDIKIF
jgi:hypothetical protein